MKTLICIQFLYFMKSMRTEPSCGKVTWKTRKHDPPTSQDLVGKTQLTFYNARAMSLHCTGR
jgi:hypothetical protein